MTLKKKYMYSKWVKYELNLDKFKLYIFVEKFSFI